MRILTVILGCAISVQAAPPSEVVAWDRTPEVFAGQYVLVKLKSGAHIEGHWARVTADSFTMNVARTTRRVEVDKGIRTIPRSSIAGIRAGVRRSRGRVIGTLAGIYLGGAIIARASNYETAMIGFYGAGTAGFFAGRAYDHATREYVIQPDPPAEPEPLPPPDLHQR